MRCACGSASKVLYRRGVKRRRECNACGSRWTTVETVIQRVSKAEVEVQQKKSRAGRAKPVRILETKSRGGEIDVDDEFDYLPEA